MKELQFRRFDIFGIRIGLRYKQKEIHQSNFGAVVTICIVGLTMVQVYLVAQELISKKNPEVISSERYVASPQRYNMNNANFNLAYGVQNGLSYEQFIDPTIYNVKAEQMIMKKVYNNQTNEYVQDFEYYPLDQFPCAKDSFQEPETQSVFQSLPNVDTMYCVNQNDPEVYMEGDFTADNFAYFKLTFTVCDQSTNPLCKDPQTVQKALIGSFVALYLNDIIVDPKNQYPFVKVEKDMFWNTSPKVAKQMTVYYRNVYVESDTGLLFENKFQERDVAISQVDEQDWKQIFAIIDVFKIVFDETSYFAQVIIRFEKQKESIYYRNYKKIDSALAQVGGIAKALMIIGFFVCVPFNRLNLHYQIACQLFNFQDEESTDNPNSQSQIKSSNQYSSQQEAKQKQLKYSLTTQVKDSKNKNMQQSYPHPLEQSEIQNITSKANHRKNASRINQNEQTEKLDQKNSKKEKKGFSLNWYEYIRYYLFYWGAFENKKQQLNNAIQHIYSHLDMLSIIHKMVELDRIKSLLFDEDQIKLISFLPKPTISLDNSLNMNVQNNSKGFPKRKEVRHFSNVLKQNDYIYDNEVDQQKNTQQAYQALKNIFMKEELTKVDAKLIEMLDDSLITHIKEQQIQQNQVEAEGVNFSFLQSKRGSRLQYAHQISCPQIKATQQDKIVEEENTSQNLWQTTHQYREQTSIFDIKQKEIEIPSIQEHQEIEHVQIPQSQSSDIFGNNNFHCEDISDSMRWNFMESSKQESNVKIQDKYIQPITSKLNSAR